MWKSQCAEHVSFGPLLEVVMTKKCTPLWREAHFEVKMLKTPHVRTHQRRITFGSWDVEKVHAAVAPSTFPSQNVQNASASDHFWKLRCRKSARCFGVKHMSKSKCTNTPCWDHFWTFRCRLVWQVQGILHIVKSEQNVEFLKRTLEEDLERCIFAWQAQYNVTRDMLITDIRRSGHWFPERGCFLEHQIFWFAKMILRDRRSTSYDLAWLLRGRRSTLHRWSGKISKRIGTRPSALHSTFHLFKEVSQNCFVFDVVNFENWGSLSELLRFQTCTKTDR